MKRATRRSKNIFHDDADNQEVKARLALGIAQLIEANGLTQTAAAELIGIQRTDLSKILRGKFSVSLERLLHIARALGSHVEIKLTVHPRRATAGRMRLVMA